MKVTAWSLDHQARGNPIPDFLIDGVSERETALVRFKECVDGSSRAWFKDTLKRKGFVYLAFFPTQMRHTQVFGASRIQFEIGDHVFHPESISIQAPVDLHGVQYHFQAGQKEQWRSFDHAAHCFGVACH